MQHAEQWQGRALKAVFWVPCLRCSRKWDQFEANRKLFKVETTFDENLYTTRLVRPTAEIERQAERIAREIESQPSRNMHMAEVGAIFPVRSPGLPLTLPVCRPFHTRKLFWPRCPPRSQGRNMRIVHL